MEIQELFYFPDMSTYTAVVSVPEILDGNFN